MSDAANDDQVEATKREKIATVEGFAAELEAHLTYCNGSLKSQLAAAHLRQICSQIRAIVGKIMEGFCPDEAELLCVDHFLDGMAVIDALAESASEPTPGVGNVPPQPTATQSSAPPIDLVPARASLATELSTWLDDAAPEHSGRLLVLRTTPGLGKTEFMIREAIRRNRNLKERVIFAVRTKSQLSGNTPELLLRFRSIDPARSFLHLPIYGRDASNCLRIEDVTNAQTNGVSPGSAVCASCEHNPKNSRAGAASTCNYYNARNRARSLLRASRHSRHQSPPIILTTHSSLMHGTLAQESEYHDIWNADVVFIDEDPTDAFEHDEFIAESELRTVIESDVCDLDSKDLAKVLLDAIQTAAQSRRDAAAVRFRMVDECNSTAHSRYDSTYALGELYRLLESARPDSKSPMTLSALVRNVSESIVVVRDSTEPEAMAVVRKLKTFSHSIIREWHLCEQLIRGHARALGIERLESSVRTSALRDADMPYIVRLECLPFDPFKRRAEDQWRYAVRVVQRFLNDQAALVVGDAYAQVKHYADMFQRPAEELSIVAQLDPDAVFIRVATNASIGNLIDGCLSEILALTEADIQASCKRGDRVVFYVHKSLRARIEAFAEEMQARFLLADVAVEHWWGGRGKDCYNGWTHVYGLSDPVPSIRGVEHNVNARAFRAAFKDADARQENDLRLRVKSPSAGIARAFRNSDPRVQIEYERTAIAEVTQAVHRVRPISNGARVVTFGEIERSKDLLLQTATVIVQGARLEKKSSCQRKAHRFDMPIAAFITFDELLSAVSAIVGHFGVWHPDFRQALVVTPVTDFSPQPIIRDDRERTEWDQTLVARVWNPVSRWQSLIANTQRPALIKLLSDAELRGLGLKPFKPALRPWWDPGRGRPPIAYYDPRFIASADAADRILHEIRDCQYGPLRDGKLVRPRFSPDLPKAFCALPF